MSLRSYFGKQNSTLGSVVPLAMFKIDMETSSVREGERGGRCLKTFPFFFPLVGWECGFSLGQVVSLVRFHPTWITAAVVWTFLWDCAKTNRWLHICLSINIHRAGRSCGEDNSTQLHYTSQPWYHTVATIPHIGAHYCILDLTIAMIPHIAGWYPTWYKFINL